MKNLRCSDSDPLLPIMEFCCNKCSFIESSYPVRILSLSLGGLDAGIAPAIRAGGGAAGD